MDCLGSSTTASRGTYKWINELVKRRQNGRFRFEIRIRAGGTQREAGVTSCAYSRPSKSVHGATSTGFQ